MAHLGWTVAAKTKSCSAACTEQASVCHQASLRAVNSKAAFKYAVSQAGYSATADALTKMNFCSAALAENPSLLYPVSLKGMEYNGAISTCEAVPSGDRQRLCCCSPSGCATSSG
jgi:hypothetical protein